jgi:hypothetical protein
MYYTNFVKTYQRLYKIRNTYLHNIYYAHKYYEQTIYFVKTISFFFIHTYFNQRLYFSVEFLNCVPTNFFYQLMMYHCRCVNIPSFNVFTFKKN